MKSANKRELTKKEADCRAQARQEAIEALRLAEALLAGAQGDFLEAHGWVHGTVGRGKAKREAWAHPARASHFDGKLVSMDRVTAVRVQRWSNAEEQDEAKKKATKKKARRA